MSVVANVPPSCRLCLRQEPLRRSHILPNFFWKAIDTQRVTGNDPSPKPWVRVLSTRNGGTHEWVRKEQVLKMASVQEWLLCHDCEQKFSGWERYARKFLYGTQAGGIRKQPLFKPRPPKRGIMGFDRVYVADHAALRLFSLSLLWRVSIASGDFYRLVKIGPIHEENLRKMLTAENPGDYSTYTFSLADVRHVAPNSPRLAGVEDWIEQPDSAPFEGQATARIGLGGYLFMFTLSALPIQSAERYGAIQPNGMLNMVLLDMEWIVGPWRGSVAAAKADDA